MLMLSYEGWLEGSFTLGCLIFGFISGIFFFSKSRKVEAKVLSHMGVLIILNSFIYIGVSMDFLHIISTGDNIDSTFQGVITYMWLPILMVVAVYIVAELLIPTRKLHITIIFVILGAIFELILFFDPKGSLYSTDPKGEALIHTNIVMGHPISVIHVLYLLTSLLFIDFGLLIRGFKSEGIIRRKYLLLSAGFINFVLLSIFDGLSNPGIALVFIRSGIFVSFLLWYLALKEKTVKHEEVQMKKKVSIEESLFRITELKPGNITEDEITFYREQKICLICKGKKLGFTYICPECEAFYCIKCAQALTDLENACWVCNLPIDKSKPTEPFKKEGELQMEVEISKDIQKKGEQGKK